MNKGSIVERLCSDLDRKEPRYKSPTLLFLTLYSCKGDLCFMKVNRVTNSRGTAYSFEIFQDGLRPPLDLVQSEVTAHDTPTPKIIVL